MFLPASQICLPMMAHLLCAVLFCERTLLLGLNCARAPAPEAAFLGPDALLQGLFYHYSTEAQHPLPAELPTPSHPATTTQLVLWGGAPRNKWAGKCSLPQARQNVLGFPSAVETKRRRRVLSGFQRKSRI